MILEPMKKRSRSHSGVGKLCGIMRYNAILCEEDAVFFLGYAGLGNFLGLTTKNNNFKILLVI